MTNDEYLKDTSLLSFSALALEVIAERTVVRPSCVEIDASGLVKLLISASISFFNVSFIANEAFARVKYECGVDSIIRYGMLGISKN